MRKQCQWLVLAALVLAVPAFAQVTFERWYGGTGRDEAALARPLADGYVAVGRTMSFGADSGDIWVIWTNLNGDTVRTRRYGVAGKAMRPSDIQLAADGGYFIGGDVRPLGQGDDARDIWLAKITATGDTQWTRTFGGALGDEAPVIQPVGDSCIVLAQYQSGLNSDHDFGLLKLDAGGSVVWEKKYGGTGTDVPKCIAPTADGGYILTGYTRLAGEPMGDVWLLKTDAACDTQWTHSFGTIAAFEQGQTVTPTDDGGYLICGSMSTTSAIDWYIVKANGSGDTMWTRLWGTALYDLGGSAIQVPGGGYVLSGFVNSNYTTSGDLCLLSLTTSGDSVWCHTYGGSGAELGFAAALCADGGYILAGMTTTYGTAVDAYLVKTDASGGIGIAEPAGQPTLGGLRLTAEPNPSSAKTTIRIPHSSLIAHHSSLSVFDAAGRLVLESPIANRQSPFALDLRSMPAGVYRCVVTADAAMVAATTLVVAR